MKEIFTAAKDFGLDVLDAATFSVSEDFREDKGRVARLVDGTIGGVGRRVRNALNGKVDNSRDGHKDNHLFQRKPEA